MKAKYLIYLCLVQTPQGFEQIAQVTSNTVQVLKQSIFYICRTEVFFSINSILYCNIVTI